MLVTFCRVLARLRFQHRVTELPDGALAYRLQGAAEHVRVTKAEWEQTGTLFNERTSASLWHAKLATWLWLPGYVVYIAICDAVVPKAVARAMPWPIYDLVFLSPLFATPFLIYLWHSHYVKRVCAEIDISFADRPRICAPTRPRWRPPFWLDLLCLLFVGPHLLVSAAGEVFPDVFRNTPLTGSHIDWQAVLGFALIVARLSWAPLSLRLRPVARDKSALGRATKKPRNTRPRGSTF